MKTQIEDNLIYVDFATRADQADIELELVKKQIADSVSNSLEKVELPGIVLHALKRYDGKKLTTRFFHKLKEELKDWRITFVKDRYEIKFLFNSINQGGKEFIFTYPLNDGKMPKFSIEKFKQINTTLFKRVGVEKKGEVSKELLEETAREVCLYNKTMKALQASKKKLEFLKRKMGLSMYGKEITSLLEELDDD
jgi:hypothetical protein